MIVLDAFSDGISTDEWVAHQGAIAPDATYVKNGSAAITLTSGVGTLGEARRPVHLYLGNTDTTHLGLWFYDTDIDRRAYVRLRLRQATGYFEQTINTKHANWHFIVPARANWAENGLPDWALPIGELSVEIMPEAGETAIVHFDSLITEFYTRPKVIVALDDGGDTVYDDAFAYMTTLALPGVSYTIPDLVDTAGYVTTAELQAMYADGWDIANHTIDHTSLTGLSQAAAAAKLTDMMDWAVAQGFTRREAYRHVAYPYGHWNATVLAAMVDAGALTGRAIGRGIQPSYSMSEERYTMSAFSLGFSLSLADAQAKVDQAIETGGTLIIYGHVLTVGAPANESEWSVADFQDLMDYVVTKRTAGELDVVTVSEWWEWLGL